MEELLLEFAPSFPHIKPEPPLFYQRDCPLSKALPESLPQLTSLEKVVETATSVVAIAGGRAAAGAFVATAGAFAATAVAGSPKDSTATRDGETPSRVKPPKPPEQSPEPSKAEARAAFATLVRYSLTRRGLVPRRRLQLDFGRKRRAGFVSFHYIFF